MSRRLSIFAIWLSVANSFISKIKDGVDAFILTLSGIVTFVFQYDTLADKDIMKKINIMGLPNGVGISRDMDILSNLLRSAGYEVDSHHMFRVKPEKFKYDLTIYLERLSPGTFEMGKLNAMIPNQEWFENEWIGILPMFDLIMAKTRFAERIFTKLGAKTDYISFTSEDRYIPDVKKDDYHWLHIAGKSVQKQTETVIQTWAKNPGFPALTIVQDPKFYKARATLKNVNFIIDHYPDPVLKIMQNSFAYHVCPSETEGFGHYIMEALSTKSFVITTNAEPMTELVTPEYGILISPVATKPMRLSTSYLVSPETLENAVVKAMILTDKRPEFGEKARSFYLRNDAIFKENFLKSVGNLLQA